MKKGFKGIITAALAIGLLTASAVTGVSEATALADDTVIYTIGEQLVDPARDMLSGSVRFNTQIVHIDPAPTVVDGRTLVPARAISEMLGADVNWYQPRREVSIELADISILLTIDSRIAVVNGNNVELDVPAQVVNGSTIIPLRFVAENLGVYVDFINGITFISTTPPHFSTTTFTSYQQILDYQAARINEVMPTLVEKIEQIAQDDIDDAWEWYLVWYSAMLVSDDISIRGSRAMNDLFYSINGDMEEFYRANGNMGEWTTYVDLMNESYMEAWNHLTDVFHELSVRLGFS